MTSAKVSVIIPNYNHARYLRKRIDSVLNQTFRDIQILVMDDRSTDDSLAVIEQYRDHQNIAIVVNETNSGNTFAQWEKGLSLTQSDYVWIAESDDCADPTFLETMVARLEKHPEAGMAVCESIIIDENDQSLGLYLNQLCEVPHFRDYDFATLRRDNLYRGRDYLKKFMVPFNTIPNASAVLFRRSAVESRVEPTMSMRLCGDWLAYCRILTEHDIVRIAAPLNHFRTHGNNVRSNTSTVDFLRQQRAVRAYVRDQLGTPEPARLARSALAFESQLLVNPRRKSPNRKIPLRDVPAALGDAYKLGFGLFCAVFALLAREQIAVLVHPAWRRTSLR